VGSAPVRRKGLTEEDENTLVLGNGAVYRIEPALPTAGRGRGAPPPSGEGRHSD